MARGTRPVVQPKAVTASIATLDERYRTLRTAIRWGAGVAGLYVFMRGLAPLSGKETVVTFALSFLADIKFVLSITLAGAAAAWAAMERKLRYRKTEYFQDRIRKLESYIDQDRSSSGLTRTGKTNPEDRRT